MKCEAVRELLPVFFEAEPREQEIVRAHLHNCSECRRELEEFEALRAGLAARAFAPEVYEAVAWRVRRRIWLSRSVRWAGAVAAAAMLAVGLTWRPPEVLPMRVSVVAPGAPAEGYRVGEPLPRGRGSAGRRVAPPKAAPMELRIVGDDPSVLIVWQFDDASKGDLE